MNDEISSGSFDLVIFGGTGDLCWRKLMPALYQAFRHGVFSSDARILAVSRQQYPREAYLDWLRGQFDKLAWEEPFDEAVWHSFAQRVYYLSCDVTNPAAYEPLVRWVREFDGRPRTNVSLSFYLATAPTLFTSIAQQLAAAGLNQPPARIVLEKPLGQDLQSAIAINAAVRKHFTESQIFRIDHYLGKQSVQNLVALRFGNAIFEPLWRRESIANVQITIAEDLGVESRGAYYNQSGALRDMVQNHLLQLLCMVAMEPPANDDADAVRNEKLKVLCSLRPLTPEVVRQHVIRGQYRRGQNAGKSVPGYLEEEGVPADSSCETFVAMRAEIDSWRWAGVPFFLRTGKRMPQRLAEICINFRTVPQTLFPTLGGSAQNRLVIRLQPDDEIQLHLFAKASNRSRAEQGRLVPVALDLNFREIFGSQTVEAYERLLRKIIQGKLDLFVRDDEQQAAWKWIAPIQNAWREEVTQLLSYNAGTWGPPASSALLARDNTCWPEEL